MQQPRLQRQVGSYPFECAHRPNERLLYDVLGLATILRQPVCQVKQRGRVTLDELLECAGIAAQVASDQQFVARNYRPAHLNTPFIGDKVSLLRSILMAADEALINII